ncbi:hypothetical protein Y032_0395g643 [Ancylostoma ceylanicum]|uniref:Uncharacterized protein n=1 Tax=Ancylostoma ceylanicum TaxID=53326 RepID=A0A016RSM9_9BILA|nr:hypothetical protein Y032_0395g643 [Ancylostoma ceylanicum]
MPHCLTLIDLRKPFVIVETEQVLEASSNQDVHQDISCVGQGDTVSMKLFTGTLENVMRTLEWDNMGARVDSRSPPSLR